MNVLFSASLIIAVLVLWLVLQRNQSTRKALSRSGQRRQTLQSLISHKGGENTQATLPSRLRHIMLARLAGVCRIYYAGNPVMLMKNLAFPALGATGVIVLNGLYIGFPDSWVAGIAGPGCFVVFYSILKKRRRKQFSADFSEALTTINGAISSGRTFLQAMSDYSQSRDNMLAEEFRMISRRLNLGEPAEAVFMESWQHYPYREYYFFIVAILLNINSGGRLREVLAKLQRSIASGIAMEKKMLSMTSEMRMSAQITGAIPFIFLILLKFISPENFDFVLHDERGKVLLYYLIGSELFGLMVIKFLMRKL